MALEPLDNIMITNIRENDVICSHVIDGHEGWWCGCGDGMTNEQHAEFGSCDTCLMWNDPEPCEAVEMYRKRNKR